MPFLIFRSLEPDELIIILAIVVVLFGASRLGDVPALRRIGRGLWDRLSPPAQWSVGLGIALSVLIWLARGDFSTAGNVSLLVVIPLWMGALRLIIFIGQLVTGRRDVDDASVDSDITTAERLRQLKRLLDEDVISESEFAAKKAELLKDL